MGEWNLQVLGRGRQDGDPVRAEKADLVVGAARCPKAQANRARGVGPGAVTGKSGRGCVGRCGTRLPGGEAD